MYSSYVVSHIQRVDCQPEKNYSTLHRTGIFPHKKKKEKKNAQQVDNDSFVYTKFDFTVDEGRERLNPSQRL